jgi:uncharacterized membrane protein YagU involved in acid resistance
VAGTLDIIAAHVHSMIKTGVFPAKMFYYIAGGAIGLKNSLGGGPAIIILGVFIHYAISFFFTLFFFLLYPAISKAPTNKYINAILYGIFVWLTMNFIVLPFTALPRTPFIFDWGKAIGLLVLMIVFGLPISLMTDRYYKKARDNDKARVALG